MRCAVVGHPVAHSLSPALYCAAYAELGIDWTFDAVDVPGGGLGDFVSRLDSSWRGLAVTMPHKAAVTALGSPDQAVKRLGVGNTLVLDADGASVHNTDVSGFIRALEYRHVDEVADVVMLGAGATARAALMALNNLGVERVTAQVRDAESPSVAAWLKMADDLGLVVGVEALGTPRGADLVLSTLPPGQADTWAEALVEGAGAVLDVAYDPWPTKLSSMAAAANLTVVTGLDLLAGQAVQQIDYLVGETVDLGLLLAAGEAELNRRRMA
ncbi:MAG: shikimate dehydrogenase [Propionibacteriaceae bacterium]|nr:shikimate dehydrogenase [Propionibacteriaceae bacterium]